jgi:hypothetical protein
MYLRKKCMIYALKTEGQEGNIGPDQGWVPVAKEEDEVGQMWLMYFV